MEIRFNVTGAGRKKLVESFSGLSGCKAVYMKAPSFAYKIGNYTIDKDGTLIFEERVCQEDVENLLAALSEQGFIYSEYFNAVDSTIETPAGSEVIGDSFVTDVHADTLETAPVEDVLDSLVIEMPMDGFSVTSLDNLDKLVASKAALIMKSIGADALPIEREDRRLRFPWFSPDSSPEEVRAYTQFIHALCEMAKKQKRITAKEKPANSEKFAFRCFLLRLGFIGGEYAAARKILLANLTGDSSFKSGKRKVRDESTTAPVGAKTADRGVESAVEAKYPRRHIKRV